MSSSDVGNDPRSDEFDESAAEQAQADLAVDLDAENARLRDRLAVLTAEMDKSLELRKKIKQLEDRLVVPADCKHEGETVAMCVPCVRALMEKQVRMDEVVAAARACTVWEDRETFEAMRAATCEYDAAEEALAVHRPGGGKT